MISVTLATILIGQPPARERTLTIFAAASLRGAFTSIAKRYELNNPGVRVVLNFAGSQVLATQIRQGARADLFASASYKNLADAKPDASSVRFFAENKLTIVARKGFGAISAPRDLAKPHRLVLADASVPAGDYAQKFLGLATEAYGKDWRPAVERNVVSRELDVRAVLTKVRLGEADAGIVYVSDAFAAGNDVRQISIPAKQNVVARYPIAITRNAVNKTHANQFVRALLSADAQLELERYGLISPLRPATELKISGKISRTVPLPFPSKLQRRTLFVTGHGKEKFTFAGVLVSSLFEDRQARVSFVAADGETKTFSGRDLGEGKAILARGKDGNYQLVVANFGPDSWLKRIRTIIVK